MSKEFAKGLEQNEGPAQEKKSTHLGGNEATAELLYIRKSRIHVGIHLIFIGQPTAMKVILNIDTCSSIVIDVMDNIDA